MQLKRSVLMVDPSEETREVLQTALRRRGVETITAHGARQGLALAEMHQPDLIVLDLEIEDSAATAAAYQPFVEHLEGEPARLVLLGAVRRSDLHPEAGEIVAKPFHYGPLIHRIECLLDGAQPPAAEAD